MIGWWKTPEVSDPDFGRLMYTRGMWRGHIAALGSGAMPAPAEPLPDIQRPGDVWPYVAIEFVVVAPVRGQLTFEVGYCVTWDEGLILGARFQEGRFGELTGRVPRAVAAWCRRRDRYSGATRTPAFAMPARHDPRHWNH